MDKSERWTDRRFEVMVQWIESTQDAARALREWLDELREWWRNGGEHNPGDFDVALRKLCEAGLERWADTNPAGGGLDALAAAVKGEELPESSEPQSLEDRVAAIFAGGGDGSV